MVFLFKEAIQAISKKYEIPIIEDSGSFRSSYQQQKCGTIGDIGNFILQW